MPSQGNVHHYQGWRAAVAARCACDLGSVLLAQTLATRFAAGATSYQNAAIAKGDGLGPGRGARLGRLGRMGRYRMVFGVAASAHGRVTLFPEQSVDNCVYGYA